MRNTVSSVASTTTREAVKTGSIYAIVPKDTEATTLTSTEAKSQTMRYTLLC